MIRIALIALVLGAASAVALAYPDGRGLTVQGLSKAKRAYPLKGCFGEIPKEPSLTVPL